MNNLNYNDPRVSAVLDNSEEKRKALKQCLDAIDVSSLEKDSIYEAKYNYDKCITNAGYSKNTVYSHIQNNI